MHQDWLCSVRYDFLIIQVAKRKKRKFLHSLLPLCSQSKSRVYLLYCWSDEFVVVIIVLLLEQKGQMVSNAATSQKSHHALS